MLTAILLMLSPVAMVAVPALLGALTLVAERKTLAVAVGA